MDKSISSDEFNSLVEMFGMKPSYTMFEQDDKKYVLESWRSKSNPFIILNTAFEFNEENLGKIESKSRSRFLRQLLDEAVERENYEEAAQLRDMIALS